MTRVKGGVHTLKTRRNVLKKVKGYRFARSKKEAAAYEAIMHAGQYAFEHRRDKKGDFRRLWNIKINAFAKQNGTSYSKLMGALKKKNIALDRKILATFAEFHPETMQKVLAASK